MEKGALLYVIEPQPYEKTLDERTAELAAQKAQAWDARLEATRFKNLLEQASTSQSNFDRRQAPLGRRHGPGRFGGGRQGQGSH